MKYVIAGALAVSLLSACATNPETGGSELSKAGGGAMIGAGVGAVLGTILGGDDKAKGAAIGAAIGGVLGAGVGSYMDEQEKKLREQTAGTGIEVTRTGDQIMLQLPSDITFESGQSYLQSQFYAPLDDIADTLVEFPSTMVDIIGHADSQGAEDYNQRLSEERAQTVLSYLLNRGVNPQRLASTGFGEMRPIADNSTEAGRAQNRRVEIILTPITEETYDGF